MRERAGKRSPCGRAPAAGSDGSQPTWLPTVHVAAITSNACISMESTVYDELMRQDEVALRLARRVADALAAGDRAEAVRLTRELERRLAETREDRSREDDVPAFQAPPTVVPVRKRTRSTRSSRQVVTEALAEIGVPCRVRILADYVEARSGERIDSRAVAALRRDERQAWVKSSARPVFIVPALEGRFFQPVRGLLSLSDWTLERRLIGPWSERADHLAATAQLARQLAWLSTRDSTVAERLAPVVAGMARSIPGAVDGREVDTGRVESAAKAEHAALAERDVPWREDAAGRAREQLTQEQQLWGARIGVVAEGER